MKKKLFFIATVLCCFLSSCTTYKASMSQPTNNPIAQKLPKMDIEWFAGGDVQGANTDFVKNIVRNEINHNVISSDGQKQGTIEVNCNKVHLKQSFGLAFLSGFTLFTFNLLGMPITNTTVDLDMSFNILNSNGEVIETYTYSTTKKSALGLYYGKDASVVIVEAAKEITKKFRDDVNSKNETIIAKLETETGNDIYYTRWRN